MKRFIEIEYSERQSVEKAIINIDSITLVTEGIRDKAVVTINSGNNTIRYSLTITYNEFVEQLKAKELM